MIYYLYIYKITEITDKLNKIELTIGFTYKVEANNILPFFFFFFFLKIYYE